MTAPVVKHQPSDWRPLIHDVVRQVWPEMPNGPRWVEAQLAVESDGDPHARSSCGAMGLMQLMPGTAAEVGVRNPYDPRESIWGGVTYLRAQFRALRSEVPDERERLRWAWASYNGGLGYALAAMQLAKASGESEWWRWGVGSPYLADPRCVSKSGRHPDHHQIRNYVARIEARGEA